MTTDDTASPPQMISREDAAEVAGVTPRTINRWVSEGILRRHYEQPGGRLRIELDQLEEYVGTHPASPVLTTEATD